MPGAQHELKKHYMAGENHHISLCYCTKRTLRKNGDNVLLTARGFSFLSVPTASGGPSCTHKATAGAGDKRQHESCTWHWTDLFSAILGGWYFHPHLKNSP